MFRCLRRSSAPYIFVRHAMGGEPSPAAEWKAAAGRHLESAWPGYTPENLRQEMIGYADNALAKRLHAIGIEMAA
ncbi:MAG: hypothetical protein WCC59_12255 [Terriglobales bacterium]